MTGSKGSRELHDVSLHVVSLLWTTHHRIELDIGSDSGVFLELAAAADPTTFFIGVEIDPERSLRAMYRLKRSGIRNAISVNHEAYSFLRTSVPVSSIDAIHVYFPNPYPHHDRQTRRLVDFDFLGQVRRVLKDGGELRMATDHAEYFSEMISSLDPGSWWGIEWRRLPFENKHDRLKIGTRCEVKYRVAKQKAIYYLHLLAV